MSSTHTISHAGGSLEVVCGCMFSGKSEELIRRLRRAVIAKKKVQVFKPKIDDRYSLEQVRSHSGVGFDAVPVNRLLQWDQPLIAVTLTPIQAAGEAEP